LENAEEKLKREKEEENQVIDTLLKADQWKYILSTNGNGVKLIENNPSIQEVNLI